MDLKDAKKLEYARKDEAQTFAENEIDEEAVECNNVIAAIGEDASSFESNANVLRIQ